MSAPRAAGLALCLALLATGCTGGGAPAAAGPAASSDRAPSAPPARASVPLRAQVTHVAGTLPEAGRRRVESQVGRTIGDYLDAAFLRGPYPRDRFSSSFGTFTAGAASRARRDTSLLTNARWGPSTRAVRSTHRTAYLSVLAPRGTAAGVTAAVDLVLRVDRTPDRHRRVHLTGRLLLAPDTSGRWRIFGYDLARSSTTPGGTS